VGRLIPRTQCDHRHALILVIIPFNHRRRVGQIRLALGYRIMLGSQLLKRCGGVRDLRLGGVQRGLEGACQSPPGSGSPAKVVDEARNQDFPATFDLLRKPVLAQI